MGVDLGDKKFRTHGMKVIKLTNRGVAFVSDRDFPGPIMKDWGMDSNGYVFRSSARDKNGKQKRIYMHREILNAGPGQEVDHRQLPKNNNCRSNLRLCTVSQNQANSQIRGRNTSGFRGVHPSKRPIGWRGAIRVNGKGIHLGYFSSRVEAAKAYDSAAKRYFGAFAQTNF